LAALVALATGVLVLFGWLLDIPSLKSVLPGFVTMKADTAVGFILAGAALALLGRAARSVRIRRLSQACAGATALLGLLTLSEYLFALDLGIDQVLFSEPAGAINTLSPGRMSPSTALNFFLLGSALLLAGFRRGIRIAQPLALLTAWIGLQALIGYLYGVSALYGIGVYTQMAVHTAVAFVILGLGILLARPAEGFMRTVTSNTMGGLLIRRIMPFVVLLPIVLGWLRVQGEQHGYFDSTFGVALMMIVIMLVAMGVTWWTAWTMNRIDMARRQTQAELRESEERYHSLYATSRDAIMMASPDRGFLAGNPAAIKMFGCRDEEDFTRRTPADLSPEYQPDGAASSAKAQEMMSLALEKGSHFFEWRHKRADGTEFPATVLLSRLETGNMRTLQAAVRDITEWKWAEQALHKSESLNRTLVENIRLGVTLIDRDHRILMVNPAQSEMFHRPPASFVGKHCFAEFEKRDRVCPHCPGKQSLETGRPAEVETEGVQDDGSRFSVRVQTFPVLGADGRADPGGGPSRRGMDLGSRHPGALYLRQPRGRAGPRLHARRGRRPEVLLRLLPLRRPRGDEACSV
jgi:PAS domain S-box-containing protein